MATARRTRLTRSIQSATRHIATASPGDAASIATTQPMIALLAIGREAETYDPGPPRRVPFHRVEPLLPLFEVDRARLRTGGYRIMRGPAASVQGRRCHRVRRHGVISSASRLSGRSGPISTCLAAHLREPDSRAARVVHVRAPVCGEAAARDLGGSAGLVRPALTDQLNHALLELRHARALGRRLVRLGPASLHVRGSISKLGK